MSMGDHAAVEVIDLPSHIILEWSPWTPWAFVALPVHAGGALQVRATLQRTRGQGFVLAPPKTKYSQRRVKLSATALTALRAHRLRQAEERLARGPLWDESYDLVFANEVGRPLEAQNLMRRSFHPLLRRAGLPAIRFHDLRHTRQH